MNCKNTNLLRVVRGNAFKLKIAVEAYTPSGRRIDSFALGEAVLKLDKNGTLTTKEYTILEGTTILVAFDGSEALGVYGFQMTGEYESEAWRWANAEIFQIVESNVRAHIPEGCVLLDDTYNMAMKIVLAGGDGVTFTPSVSEQGIISWTNDGGLPNPEPRNIRGPRGEQGPQGEVGPQGPRGQMGLRGQIGPKGDKGDKGDTGATPIIDATASVDENVGNPMVVVESFGSAEHRTFDFQFKNLKGQKGETGATGAQGPQGIQGPQGEPGNYTKPASGIPMSDLNGNVASGIVYDVTANNSGATFASLSALLSSGSLSTLIPTDVRKGGMQIRFVCSSDNNYVQFRYMPSDAATAATFTNPANWVNVEDEVSQLEHKVDDLDAEVNGVNRETQVTPTWNNGYIVESNGVIGGRTQTTYQYSDAIELTDNVQTIRCYGAPNAANLASVGFYTISSLPISSGQAARTVGVIVNTQTGTDNTVMEIGAEKIAQMKQAGAHYFSVCVLASGTKGISYFTMLRGIVDDISDLDDKVDSCDSEIESIENGVVQETEQPSTVFEYGYITPDGKFPNPGSGTTYSRTSPIEIGDIISIRAMAMLNSSDAGGVFFFKTSQTPTTQANADLVGVIGGNTTTTAGYVNDEITITREQIRQMQAQGAKYFAVSSYTDGAKLYTSVDAQDGLLQINEKIANLEDVTETCRKRIDITLQDTQDEILAKLIKAYDGEDYDVFWECGTYQFNTVWVTMRTMNRFNSIGTWEMPIGGKNNRYFFNGSIIIGSGIYDLIGSYCQNSNLFGTLRKGNHIYDLHDATLIISDGNYCFHDETSSEPGYNVHRYHNIKFINQPTEHSGWIHTGLGIGNGQNTTIILDGCYAGCTDGEPGIRNHGMKHESGETPLESHSRFVFKNCYFANGAQLGNLDQNENCDVVVSGCSYTSFVISENGQGVYTTYFYCNEVRS